MQWACFYTYIVHISKFIPFLLTWTFVCFNIRMKAAFILIFCLPCLFAETASDVALDAYKRMTPEERMSGKVNLTKSQYWYRFLHLDTLSCIYPWQIPTNSFIECNAKAGAPRRRRSTTTRIQFVGVFFSLAFVQIQQIRLTLDCYNWHCTNYQLRPVIG